jgi:hydrogenase-4 component B
MLIGMGFLAVLCVALGLLPTVVVRLIAPVINALTGAAAEPSLGNFPTVITGHAGALAPLALCVLLLAGCGLALLLARAIGGRGHSRVSAPWGCGITLEPSMQYTATAFAQPVRVIFRRLLRPYREIERVRVPGASYFVASVRYEAGIQPIYERFIYRPIIDGMLVLASQIRALQNGSLRTYLAYICVALIVLLLLAR